MKEKNNDKNNDKKISKENNDFEELENEEECSSCKSCSGGGCDSSFSFGSPFDKF